MKFAATLAALALANVALAAPSPTYKFRRDLTSKFGRSHRVIPASEKTDAEADFETYNWSGAFQSQASGGAKLTSVAASFPIPTPSIPKGAAAGEYYGASWVGLGGVESGDSLWQAGSIWVVDNSNGTTQYGYGVWYEWLPNDLIVIDNFNVSPGDVIQVNLRSTSPSKGVVVIADKTTGQKTTITTSAPTSTATLLGATAEWVTEDISLSTGLAPFANYHKVKYSNCAFGEAGGTKGNLAGAEQIQLVSQSTGKIVSRGKIQSDTALLTTYV